MSSAGLARIRRSVATVVALAVIAMQWTIAAHACTVVTSGWAVPAAVQGAVVANDGMAMPDCDDAGMKAAANGKICAAHCQADSQVDVDGITLVPAIAPQPALSISVAAPVQPRFAVASPLLARGAASPLSILFRRLLI
jgi:hypothetical protein